MRRATRYPVLAALALLVAGAVLPAPRVDRYGFVYTANTVTDMSGFGQPDQVADLELRGALSVTVEEGTEGRKVTIMLDSLSGTGTGPQWGMLESSIPEAIGTEWVGGFDEKGRLVDLTANRSNPMVEQFEGAVLSYLYPAYHPTATAGAEWVDTVDVSRTTSQGPQHSVTTTTYKVAEPGTIHGLDYVRVAADFTSDITIQQESQGFEITGGATGTGDFLMAGDGRSLGATRDATVELIVEGGTLPQPIPVSVRTKMTVEHLP